MPHTTRPVSNRYRVKVLSLTVVRDGGAPDPRILSSPSAVVELMRDLMPDDDREHLWALYLNAQNHLLEVYPVSTGTLTASLVSPREIFKPAILRAAASVIVVHNHPSGEPTPSREDLQLTRQLTKAAEVLDLRLHDHVIIGNGTGRWVSLAQQGML